MVPESNKQYLLSVIIPISRMAGRLQNLEVTLSNLHKEKDIQMILIHDIQDSETAQEIRRILDQHPSNSTTLVEKYFGSPGSARNFGMEFVKGSWVNFVDSDDIFMPADLVKELSSAESLTYSAFISNYEKVDTKTNEISRQVHKNSLTNVALSPGLWRWTFNANLIRNTRFSKLSMGEDQKFLYDFCKVSQKIKFLEPVTYRYTTNQDNQLTNQSMPKRDLIQVLGEIMKIRRYSQVYYDEFTETMIIKLFASTIIHSTLSKKVKSFSIFIPALIPFLRVRLRFGKLRLRYWFNI